MANVMGINDFVRHINSNYDTLHETPLIYYVNISQSQNVVTTLKAYSNVLFVNASQVIVSDIIPMPVIKGHSTNFCFPKEFDKRQIIVLTNVEFSPSLIKIFLQYFMEHPIEYHNSHVVILYDNPIILNLGNALIDKVISVNLLGK